MVHGVGRDHEVADVDARVKRPGDAGVDHVRDAVEVDHDLRAQGGVDLADSAARHHDGLPVQGSLVELHPGVGGGRAAVERLPQQLDLDLHGADDADLVAHARSFLGGEGAGIPGAPGHGISFPKALFPEMPVPPFLKSTIWHGGGTCGVARTGPVKPHGNRLADAGPFRTQIRPPRGDCGPSTRGSGNGFASIARVAVSAPSRGLRLINLHLAALRLEEREFPSPRGD